MKYGKVLDKRANLFFAATGTVALLAPAAIFAQQLEEIVVTAERREQSLEDTPLSVAAFSPQVLEERVIVDMFDIQSATPNLNIRPGRTQGATNPDFNIRGITGDGSQAAVAFYIDDVYFPSPGRNALRAVDIESIEVLRGPQGTLFGRNSTGGAIRVTTRKPSEDFYANMELRAGDYGRTDLEFDVNVPLSDTFFMKANIASLNRDGYITKVGVPGDQGKTGNIDDTVGSVAFRWLASDDVTVDLKYRSEDQQGNSSMRVIEYLDLQGPLGFHLAQLDRALTLHGEPGITENDPRMVLGDYTAPGFCFLFDMEATSWEPECDTLSRAENSQITAAVSWELNDNHTLKFNIGKHDIWNERAVDWLGWGAEIRHEIYETQATTAELVLNSALADGKLDLVSGINYFDSDEYDDQWIIRNHNPDNDADFRDIWGDSQAASATGVFAQGTWHFGNDATNLTVGLRHTNEDASATFREWESGDFDIRGWNDCTTSAATSAAVMVRDPNCVWIKSDSDSWSETDYRVAIDHQINEPLMVYASVSKAYRAGVYAHPAGNGPSDPAQYDPANYDLAPTPPEKVVSTEIGLRSTWMDNRLRWNLTLFDMDQTNRQGFVNDFSTGSVILIQTVLGDVTSKGWETDLDVAATDSLTLNVSAGYTDAFIIGNPTTGTYGSIDQIQNTPKYAYTVALNHRAEVWGGQLRSSLNYTWQDDMFGLNDPERDEFNVTPAYGLLNGRIMMSWPDRGLSVSLEGTNLADKTYARSTFLMGRIFHGPVANDPNIRNFMNYIDRAAPRMLSLVVTKEFGGN
jgi:iron complex outermembrane receptor protein